jgi:DNA polymerase-3 subunit alpha
VGDWLPAERLDEEAKAIGFFLSGHPLEDYMPALKRKKVLTLDEVAEQAKGGACVVKLAGRVSGRQERKSARGNRFAFAQLSDPTGAYEVTIFSETLEKSREYLETGSKVVVTAEATLEADQLKLLARAIAPIDTVVADAGSAGLKVFVEDIEAVQPVANVLMQAAETVKAGAKGPVLLCLMSGDLPGEVEIDTGREFPVNPQIKGAIKSLDGVMAVEEY